MTVRHDVDIQGAAARIAGERYVAEGHFIHRASDHQTVGMGLMVLGPSTGGHDRYDEAAARARLFAAAPELAWFLEAALDGAAQDEAWRRAAIALLEGLAIPT